MTSFECSGILNNAPSVRESDHQTSKLFPGLGLHFRIEPGACNRPVPAYGGHGHVECVSNFVLTQSDEIAHFHHVREEIAQTIISDTEEEEAGRTCRGSAGFIWTELSTAGFSQILI